MDRSQPPCCRCRQSPHLSAALIGSEPWGRDLHCGLHWAPTSGPAQWRRQAPVAVTPSAVGAPWATQLSHSLQTARRGRHS